MNYEKITMKEVKAEGIVMKTGAAFISTSSFRPQGTLFLTKQRIAFLKKPMFVFPIIGGLIGILLASVLSKFVHNVPVTDIQEVSVGMEKSLGMKFKHIEFKLKNGESLKFQIVFGKPEKWVDALKNLGVASPVTV